MSRIFISHSSANNAEAIALRDWLVAEGWGDLFLDLDPDRGIAAGERWERALNEAARRCEAVIFLISKAWLASRWCTNELTLARRLNKRLFGVLVEEGLTVADLPHDVTSTWQLVNLATGRDHRQFRVTLPVTGEEVHVTYSHEGLGRLKGGLQRAGLHASYFNWPPETDPKRAPYRGLRPLEADDAGIFFGREAFVVEAIDKLRGLTEAAPPRLLAILGASGAGKSSALRAGLLPRLGRDPRTFLPLPVIRPERAALTGETGLVNALSNACETARLHVARGDIRDAVEGGAVKLKPLLTLLQNAAAIPVIDGEAAAKPATLVIAIDQGEELFLAEAHGEAAPFLALLRDLLLTDNPAVIAVFTIRTDNYERLQTAPELEGVYQTTLSLPTMPKGAYAEVVKGPARRLDGTARAIRIDDALVEALLSDIETGGAKDALPLLAFTLERLYGEYGSSATASHLTLDHYVRLGRIKGSIEAAVERAFKAADADSRIPREGQARLTLLRRGLIPWLAGIDPDTKAPRRRVARLSEIPAEARPLIDLLVEQRLLSTDISKVGEKTIEPAHEALLRQWGLLQGWLNDDTGLLTVLDGIKRASGDWDAYRKAPAHLSHNADRLRAAEQLLARPDLAANLEPADTAYMKACQQQERAVRARAQRGKMVLGALAASVVGLLGLAATGVLEPNAMKVQARRLADLHMPALGTVPAVLTAEKERALKAGDPFQECWSCPEMVVVPPGAFMMGSNDGGDDEKPVHKVTISAPFAVGRFEVTFDEWDGCVAHGGCPAEGVAGANFGRGRQPVINVNWDDAKKYVEWLSKRTGKTYRLLTEAEWEYAARAGTTTKFSFGDEESGLSEHAWFSANSESRAHPVGKKKPNAFSLHDMHGNVWEWVEDCHVDNYNGAPENGTARPSPSCRSRVLRGGAWSGGPDILRSAQRDRYVPGDRDSIIGFRVARVLSPART